MNKAIILCLLSAISLSFTDYGYNGSTTGVVTLVGGIIKTKNLIDNKKYKRKDCPVCKGKGWYVSGDGIEKVPCGYCEPDNTESLTHPPIIISGSTPDCKTRVIKK
jgi:hypothetical protein